MAAPAIAPPRDNAPLHPEVWEELANLELVDSDGENMESDWHRDAMNLLIESVRYHHAGRTDYFVGGNMFIYFSLEHARNRDFRGPDFFYVSGCLLLPQRRWWALWDEGGRYPNAIIELISRSTEREDRITKFNVYEQSFRTPDYFLYDPDSRRLNGFRHTGGRYLALTLNDQGRLWCEELQLWLGPWQGVFHGYNAIWLRFFHPDGRLVLIGEEAERQKAEAARQQAEAARQEAEAARQRADAAEAELGRLRALLAHKPGANGPG